jgi:hypothetical protein
VNNPGTANNAVGLYDFNLLITRAGADIQISTTFTRIGFLSGNALDADQLTLSALALESPYTPPPPPVPGDIVEVAPDGTWTWFNDERSTWHEGMLFSGYVRSDGNPGVTRYYHLTGAANHTKLPFFS